MSMTRGPLTLALLLIVLASMLAGSIAVAPAATEATATTNDGLIEVIGADGNDNVTVSPLPSGLSGYIIQDSVSIIAGDGCLQILPTLVSCGFGSTVTAIDVQGGSGNDIVAFDATQTFPHATASGGSGDDSLQKVDEGWGDAGADTLVARDRTGVPWPASTGYGGSGNDSVLNFDFAFGDDYVPTNTTQTSGPNDGSDYISGRSDRQGSFYGAGGNDTIVAQAASDPGRTENDIYGGAGNDHLTGAAGQDYLRGLDGNDTVDGGSGSDYIIGDDGDDALNSRDGYRDQHVSCGAGTDSITRDAFDPTNTDCESVS